MKANCAILAVVSMLFLLTSDVSASPKVTQDKNEIEERSYEKIDSFWKKSSPVSLDESAAGIGK